MANDKESRIEKCIYNMQMLARDMRDIAFHISNTSATAYGNDGCEHGAVKLLDDCGVTRQKDIETLAKVAQLFENFWGKTAELGDNK